MFMRLLILPALLVAMTACNKASETATADAPVAPAAEAVASSPAAGAESVQYLTLESSSVDLCAHPDGLMATQVTWDASSLQTDGVQIWLENPGEPRKLWAENTPTGSERTGEWLRKGSKVILINGADDAVLQEVVISETPCSTP